MNIAECRKYETQARMLLPPVLHEFLCFEHDGKMVLEALSLDNETRVIAHGSRNSHPEHAFQECIAQIKVALDNNLKWTDSK